MIHVPVISIPAEVVGYKHTVDTGDQDAVDVLLAYLEEKPGFVCLQQIKKPC